MTQNSPEARTLRMLSAGHYALAVLAAVASLPAAWLAARAGARVALHFTHGHAHLVRAFELGVAAAVGLAALACAGMAFLAGQNLGRGRRYSFCLLAAAVGCLVVPVGTVLGLYTITVLSRPAVRERFS